MGLEEGFKAQCQDMDQAEWESQYFDFEQRHGSEEMNLAGN